MLGKEPNGSYAHVSTDTIIVIVEVAIKMSQHNNLNWKDFILCLSMELAFGDGSKDNEVYKTIENKMSRLEYYDIKKEVVT